MMSQRVLFLQKEFKKGGGIEKVQKNLALEFERLGVFAHFHIINIKQSCTAIETNIAPISFSYTSNKQSFWKKLEAIFSVIKKHKINTIISATETANILTMFCKCRFPSLNVIFTRHCALEVSDQKLGPSSLKALYNLYLFFGRVVTVSRALEAQLCKSVVFHKNRINFLPNPSITKANYDLAREAFDNDGCEYFLAVGRFEQQKGFDLLVAAYSLALKEVSNLPDLIIVGDGSERQKIVKLINSKDLQHRVKLTGFLNNPYSLLQSAEVFLLSSRNEGMPTVLIEALSLDTPCISFDCPTGPNEIIQNEVNGVLIENGDVQAFAKQLIDYKKVPRNHLRKSVAQFEEETAARRYIDYIGNRK